jgi:hypothetical protein
MSLLCTSRIRQPFIHILVRKVNMLYFVTYNFQGWGRNKRRKKREHRLSISS